MNASPLPPSPLGRRIGWVLTVLATLFLLADAAGKILQPAPVVTASAQLGFPQATLLGIGVALAACTVLALLPRTAVLGAVLITGYLGGAVAAKVRVLAPTWEILFPAAFAVLLWAGIGLREPRLRQLFPLRGA